MTNISSSEFIDSISFDSFKTYFFQRGSAYKREQGVNVKIEEAQQYLYDQKGMLHASAQQTGLFLKASTFGQEIKRILRMPIVAIPEWMCAPIYREAIVFYKEEQRVATLNVCFSCQYIALDSDTFIDLDVKAWQELTRFFQKIGHPLVEE